MPYSTLVYYAHDVGLQYTLWYWYPCYLCLIEHRYDSVNRTELSSVITSVITEVITETEVICMKK